MKTPRAIALCGLVLVTASAAIGLAACKKDAGATAAPDRGRGMRGDGGLVFAVDTFEVKAEKVDYAVTAPGTIEAFERVQVTARVAGVVDRVAFSEGQQVKKGDTLVVIDSERYRLAVNSAKANVEKATAAQQDTEAMVSRREGASATHPGLIPGEELATYRTKSLIAKADTAVVSEALKVAELNLRDSAVRAPIEGVIQTRTVETGQYVNPGYVMATLLRAEPMLLRFQVEPQEAARIRPGMKASFTMRETQRTFSATVTLVAGAADPTTRMVGITGEIVDEGHKYWLRPGSFCDVALDVGATRDAPVVPRTATRPTDHGYVVYVVENGVAAERPVKLGMSSKNGWVEVRQGVVAGEQIVVRGAEALTTGARVRANKLETFDPLAGVAPPKEPSSEGAPDGGASGGGGGAERPRRRRDAGAP